ncbi:MULTISPECIES: conjugal transfer protein TraJ [Halomonadaceae]|uniref:plasmid mobilization protein n=1 Tax=Halomonadaceae TaxID=28256 RepID=UPI00159ADECC|nr:MULTISPECIES: conjugal transfer protein TraJ [Halomonas]QJQ94827.1 conjugal transfer protein TraJ [Halomonas sp. PA5]
MGSQTRVRQKPIKVWVDEGEKLSIESNAKACNMSSSAFLRNLGLGYEPKSMLDHAAIGDLMRLNGDLGRLGGLLKMALTNSKGHRGEVEEIVELSVLLSRIEQLRSEIRDKVQVI